jgi:hypothetical protein
LRFIEIPLPPNLPANWPKIYLVRVGVVAGFATSATRSIYIRKHGSWGLLKSWLAKASGSKCWYCETKSNRAPLDVDHFRPKLAVTVDGFTLIGHDGYWWLAYEWSNFRLHASGATAPKKMMTQHCTAKPMSFPFATKRIGVRHLRPHWLKSRQNSSTRAW